MSTNETKKTLKKNFFESNKTIMIMTGGLVVAAFFSGFFYGQLTILKSGATPGLNAQAGDTAAPSQAAPPAPEPIVEVSIDDDPILGDANAPITMIEFSDYECPFCKRHFTETYPDLVKNFIDTGIVKLVFRDLPLPFHDPLASQQAMAASCARDQGGDEMYFKYHDEIFNRTESNGNGMPESELNAIADDLGLNQNTFTQCLESDKYAEEVKADLADATSAGASGTPTFFIGSSTSDGTIQGERLVGAQPYSAIEAVINKYLE